MSLNTSPIEKLVCAVATSKMIEDHAIGTICGIIGVFPDCVATLENDWDKVIAMCPKGRETVFTGTAMPVTVAMTGRSDLSKLVCEVAEQKWIEDRATNLICSAIIKQMPIPDCQATLEKLWDKIAAMCPRGREMVDIVRPIMGSPAVIV